MELSEKDLPKIIAFAEKELENPIFPMKNAMELMIKSWKDDYITFVFEAYKFENEEYLNRRYEESLSYKGKSTNNGENLEWFSDYCYDQFLWELSTTSDKPTYEKVVEAVANNSFNI